MKKDRFLNGILVGIGLLILIALVLFFARQNQAKYLSEDTPKGVVNNYILAVIQHDYEKAYPYLINSKDKPDKVNFQQELARTSNEISQLNVTIGDVYIDHDSATVQLNIRQYYEGAFNNLSRYSDVAQLTLENGQWKISSMPYPLWSWNWYVPNAYPTPEPGANQ